MFEGGDPIPDCGGFLIGALGGGLDHLLFEVGQPFAGFAVEKLAGGVEALLVFGLGDFIGVLVDFAAGVVVEPPAPVVEPDRRRVPQQDAEFTTEFGEGLAEVAGMGERTVVAGVAVGAVAGEAESGQCLPGIHADEEKALVVGEISVVARLVFFDQLAFQQQSFRFRFHDENLKVVDEVEHRTDLGLGDHEFARRLEIRADPFLQVFGFSHVDGLSQPVLHQIDARLMWQAANFFFEVNFVWLWHLFCFQVYVF